MKTWDYYSATARRRLQPLIDSGQALCGRCGRPVLPGMLWDVGHVLDVDTHPELMDAPTNQRIEHRSCNRSAGARHGNRKRRARLPRPLPLPDPSREW